MGYLNDISFTKCTSCYKNNYFSDKKIFFLENHKDLNYGVHQRATGYSKIPIQKKLFFRQKNKYFSENHKDLNSWGLYKSHRIL